MPLTSSLRALRRDAAPSDLQFLTDENIAEIGAQSSSKVMTLDKRLIGLGACRHGNDAHREDATAGGIAGSAW